MTQSMMESEHGYRLSTCLSTSALACVAWRWCGWRLVVVAQVIVIGAVAWVILGPKELFRLSKEAGQFLGQWHQPF